jgi:oligosaccharyltransferase complex subunit beta
MLSIEVYSNVKHFHSYSKSGNQEFIHQLSQWTFQEKGVLKVVGHSHHKQNDTEQLEWYRVKDDIVSY